MNQNICNICGANYEYRNGRWFCPACGAYKQEELSNEEVTLLYNAAQKLRIQEFDDAEELYLDIIQKYPKQHEAYWGYVCSRFGIKIEEDFDGRRIPTCCFPTIESFSDDKDFQKAVEYAPAAMKAWYKGQAEYIEKVRKEWIEKANKEEPYDIFISYKDSDIEKGIDRTRDSINALELYNHLARQGYNVFYSRESLRDKIGEKYEPYIFNALKTAKIMILYGTSVEYINSTWVKNEWHRYLKQIARGEKKENSLLVVCDGFSPNQLPKVLSSKQCLDGESKTLYIDIDNYLKQLFTKEKKVEVKSKKQIKISPLHEHTYKDEIIPATCIARGYTVHKCDCGYEYKDNYTPLAEHTYEYKSTKEPTCLEDGYKEYICSVCGDKKRERIPAKGHNFGKWIEKISPTCTIAGKKIRQCSECGFVEEETLPAKGHKWSPIEQRIDKNGNKEYVSYCKLCGEEKVSKETEEERKAKEAQAELSKKSLGSAIGSGITALAFFIFMIVNFVGGEKIGWGIFFLIIAICCGGASISFTKEFLKNKPPISEEERIKRKKKLTIISIVVVAIIVLSIILSVVIVRSNPKSQFEYTKWWSNDYVTIKGIKNEDYAIKDNTVEIPSTIDGKQVGLGSLVFKGYSFTTLIIPKNLQEIFSDSLDGCIGLKNIVYKGTISDWKKIDGSDDLDISKYNFTHEGSCECTSWEIASNYDCEIGTTKTRSCLYCDKVYTETIAPTSHTSQTIPRVEPTCTTKGKTAGVKCSVCNKILTPQEDISMSAHVEVVDKAIPATCTSTGLTQGSHCSVCKKILVAQTVTSIAKHSLSSWVTTVPATCITYGLQTQSCANCDYEDYRDVVPKGHSFNSSQCSVCSMPKPSSGLELTLSDDFYTVTGIGTCTDTNIVLPDFYNGKYVTSVAESAFWGENITSVYVPYGIWEIGDYAFANCKQLTKIDIGETVYSLGSSMLAGCTNIQEIKIPTITFGYIGYIFEDGTKTGYMYQDDNVPASLKKVTITTLDTIYEHAFAYCENIETIILPDNLVVIEDSAFTGCKKLNAIVLPNTLTSIGMYAFKDCDSLSEIAIPANVLTIGKEAFKESGIQKVTWANNCKIQSLGESAFWYCTHIKKFTIPKSVNSIGRNLLTGCYNLEELVFEEPNGWLVQEGLYDATISVPAKALQNNESALTYFTDTYEWYYWSRTISANEISNLQSYINKSNWSGFVEAANGLTADYMSSLTFTSSQKKSFYDFLIGRIEYDTYISDFCWEFDEDEQFFLLISDYTDAYNVIQLDAIFSQIDNYSYADNSYMALFSAKITQLENLWDTKYVRDLLTSDSYVYYYMTGYWKSPSNTSINIRFYANSGSELTYMTYNKLPFPSETYDYWDIENGEMVLCDNDNNVVAKAFKFTFISSNEVQVYCYKDGSTHTLKRT